MAVLSGQGPDKAPSLGNLKRLLCPPFRRADWQSAIHPHFHVRIGNVTAVTEQRPALDQIERLIASIDGFDTHFCEVWIRGNTLIAETQVCYRDALGEAQAIPCAIIARRMGGKFADLRIILDPTPLFRAIRIDG